MHCIASHALVALPPLVETAVEIDVSPLLNDYYQLPHGIMSVTIERRCDKDCITTKNEQNTTFRQLFIIDYDSNAIICVIK
jgi:hypothetical protein